MNTQAAEPRRPRSIPIKATGNKTNQQAGERESLPSTPCRQNIEFKQDLITLIPYLRAFSRAVCKRGEIAEDLAQEALMKAWRARDTFKSGTNLKAWLFTILRNEYYSYTRRAWRETCWDDGLGERIKAPERAQEWAMDLNDAFRALDQMPGEQREALLLVAADGFTYEEAADICGVVIGTVKSRVARGRAALIHILDGRKPLHKAVPDRMRGASSHVFGQHNTFTPRHHATSTVIRALNEWRGTA